MTSVLFVCLGNICRSPLAEGIFRWLLREKKLEGRVLVDSAGTSAYHEGDPPHPLTREHVLKTLGLDLSKQRSRQVKGEDFGRFDFIVAMDESNMEDLRSWPEHRDAQQMALLSSFARVPVPRDVPDPFFGGADGFGRTQGIVLEGCRGLLETLIEEMGR